MPDEAPLVCGRECALFLRWENCLNLCRAHPDPGLGIPNCYSSVPIGQPCIHGLTPVTARERAGDLGFLKNGSPAICTSGCAFFYSYAGGEDSFCVWGTLMGKRDPGDPKYVPWHKKDLQINCTPGKPCRLGFSESKLAEMVRGLRRTP